MIISLTSQLVGIKQLAIEKAQQEGQIVMCFETT